MLESKGQKKWYVTWDPIDQKAQCKNPWHIGDLNGPFWTQNVLQRETTKSFL